MISGFLDYAISQRNDSLFKTEALFIENKNQFLLDFAEHFLLLCSEIVKLQNESTINAISHIEYTMLYTNFINRKYIAEVWLYSDMRYLDKKQHMVGEYDISHLFVFYDDLWDRLLAARKQYIGKVRALEVASYMLQVLPDFFSYLIKIARLAIADCSDKESFIGVKKNETFRVNVGDYGVYMPGTETVFAIDTERNAESLAKWFSEGLEYEYQYGDYSSLDFSGYLFRFFMLRYTLFSHAILDNASFEGSVLIGANFHRAHMENCRFDDCSIHEVDFSYAFLKNASFFYARGRAGLPSKEEWRHVGFLPVNFCCADLTNANCSYSDLSEADFTDSVLIGANFTNANLTGAVFNGANLNKTDFTSARLINADFTGAIIDGAIFDGCIGWKD